MTSLLRDRMSYRAWRAVHWLSYASWPVALARAGSRYRHPPVPGFSVLDRVVRGERPRRGSMAAHPRSASFCGEPIVTQDQTMPEAVRAPAPAVTEIPVRRLTAGWHRPEVPRTSSSIWPGTARCPRRAAG